MGHGVEKGTELAAGERESANGIGPAFTQDTGAFIECGACGEHIVHQKKLLTLHGDILP